MKLISEMYTKIRDLLDILVQPHYFQDKAEISIFILTFCVAIFGGGGFLLYMASSMFSKGRISSG